MTLKLRPAGWQDYNAILACADAAVPYDRAGNRRWLFYRHQFNEQQRLRHHYVATDDQDTLLGYGAIEQQAETGDRLRLYIVTPAEQLELAGDALYARLLKDAGASGTQRLWTREHARDEQMARFLSDRGFIETGRHWDHRLKLEEARLQPFLPRMEELKQAGYQVETLSGLRRSDPAHLERLYDLLAATQPDDQPPLLPEAVVRWLHRPDIVPEAFFIVCHPDTQQYLGFTHLTPVEAEAGWLTQHPVAVRSEYRRQGLALMLRLHAIRYAQAEQAAMVVTYTGHEDFTLLALNEKLGFQPAFAYVTMECAL